MHTDERRSRIGLYLAMAKLREFADLGYPANVRKDACCRVASSGGGAIWIVVALTQR